MDALNRTTSVSGIVCLAVTFLITTPTRATVTAFGSLSDATADNDPDGPDITSASVSIDSSDIVTFSVTFAPGTSLEDIFATFVLDADQNPATGYPGIDAANSDTSLIGAEFIVRIRGSGFQASATVLSAPSFVTLGTFGADYSENTAQVLVPLATFGDDEGLMNFKVTSQKQLSDVASTPVADYATDLGQAVGIVVSLPDGDGDGIPDGSDNCPQHANSNQTNTDGANDGGDVCDLDDDDDGVDDGIDNCPLHTNPDQADFDQDGGGDACDVDADGDGVQDVGDQCLYTPGDVVDAAGCSIDDLAPCVLPSPAVWKSHGAYVSAVAKAAQRFEELGLIDNVGDYVSSRAESACGSGH